MEIYTDGKLTAIYIDPISNAGLSKLRKIRYKTFIDKDKAYRNKTFSSKIHISAISKDKLYSYYMDEVNEFTDVKYYWFNCPANDGFNMVLVLTTDCDELYDVWYYMRGKRVYILTDVKADYIDMVYSEVVRRDREF